MTTPVSETGVYTELFEQLPILKEATTSRVIVNNKVLRHVLFAFDKGQVLTKHTSSRAVIVNALSGEVVFNMDGKDHVLHAGDVIYLAPNEPHAVEATEACYMSLTLVDVDQTAGKDEKE